MKILIVEDDKALLEQLSNKLRSNGHKVDCSEDGEDGLFRGREYIYDLAIIDIGLPKINGNDLIKLLREEGKTLPIIVLTARSSWQDKVHGLKNGADDYIVKPFQYEELDARIQALLRRSGGHANTKMNKGPITLDIENQQVWVKDVEIDLTAFEYKVLQFLMLNPNKVVSKATLIDYLYEESTEREGNVIEVIIARLRQKLSNNKEFNPIETLRGRGYRLAKDKNE